MSILKRFPSYDLLLKNALVALLRFPFAMLSAFLGTGVAMTLASDPAESVEHLLLRILMSAGLGLPLSFALATFGETQGWPRAKSLVVQAVGALLLVGYFLTLPADVTSYYLPITRFVILAIGLHFLVAFLPYLRSGQMNAFWQFNKSLFLRFLTAALYSAVLYIGLTLALAAADYLFGVNVPERRYFQLWILIVGVFNTWVFLAGVPNDLKSMGQSEAYPNGLKVFTQFILLPLVGLYFVILFAYELKIIFEWNWPKGWVSNMVLWYSVVGILSMLLLHPLRERTESRWIQVFFRWFFRVLVPLVVMLFLAIIVRISDYGVTENRYFVFAMAIGLALVMLYFIFSRAKDIRIIPIVLCVLTFVSAYGPWSAFAVSERSQMTRLMTYLASNEFVAESTAKDSVDSTALPGDSTEPADAVEIFDNGEGSGVAVINTGDQRESTADLSPYGRTTREMSSIVEYLSEWHGTEPFRELIGDTLVAALDTLPRYSRALQICESLGFELTSIGSSSEGGQWYFKFILAPSVVIPITGYDYMIALDIERSRPYPQKAALAADSLYLTMDSTQANFLLEIRRDGEMIDQVRFELTDTLISLAVPVRRRTLLPSDLTFEATGKRYEARIVLRQISGYQMANSLEVGGAYGQIFLRMK